MKIEKRLYDDSIACRDLKDKDLILVVGSTGVGKSTLVNLLVNGPNSLYFDDDEDFFLLK